MTMSIEQRKNLKDELNEAIYTVITTQYKKDAKQAHEMVSAFGYGISKYDGHYRVTSKETGKAVYVCFESYRYRRFSLGNNTKDQHKGTIGYGHCPIDFVGYLAKPYNKVYEDLKYSRRNRRSQAIKNYGQLKDTRWDIKYHEDEIEKIKAQIDKLENEIIYHARRQAFYEDQLRQQRRELHLA